MNLNKEIKRFQIGFLLRIILFWIIIFILFITVRYLEFNSFDAITNIGFGGLSLGHQLLNVLPAAFLFGLIFGLLEIYAFSRFRISKSFWVRILIKSIIYTFIILLVTLITYGRADGRYGSFIEEYSLFIQTDGFLGVALYIFSFSIVINLIIRTYKIMGPNFFSEVMTGKYRDPQEEERVVMFIDLNNSTTLTEEMGHRIMSAFMQDIFGRLSKMLVTYDGELYQFAGDEAVISWKVNSTPIPPKCLDFYYDYTQYLDSKSEYFDDIYGTTPKFKAGIHFGKVMISQIDGYKTQKAFFGDVLNTAARLRGQCKVMEREVLISDALYQNINLMGKYKAEDMGEAQFREKKTYTKVFAIHPAEIDFAV